MGDCRDSGLQTGAATNALASDEFRAVKHRYAAVTQSVRQMMIYSLEACATNHPGSDCSDSSSCNADASSTSSTESSALFLRGMLKVSCRRKFLCILVVIIRHDFETMQACSKGHGHIIVLEN